MDESPMIVLYGFLEGDTIGLLTFAYEHETVADLAAKLQKAARLRVAPFEAPVLLHEGKALDPAWKVGRAGLRDLDRFDVVRPGGKDGNGLREGRRG